MTSKILIALALIAVALVLWWASGLGRSQAEPERFFTDEQIDRAEEYRGPVHLGLLLGTLIGVGVLAVLAFTPVGDRLLGPLRRWPWPVAALGAVAIVLLVRAAARLPVSFWLGHLHEKDWGFSTQSAGGWFGDWAKALGISLVVAAVSYLGFVWLVRALPRAWPAVAAVGAAGLVILLSFVFPVLVEPVFNKFTPLRAPALVEDLKGLADRAGVPVKEVLVADASRRTTKENAYVSGFGSTKRLVLFDTLLDRAGEDEVKLVVAHELGHRRERHVELGTVIGALGAAAAVIVLWLLVRSDAVLRVARAMGPGDPRLLPFLALAVAAMTLITLPPSNWVSRRFEESADRFALRLSGDRQTYVETERGLALRNLSDLDPGPVVYRFVFTHPAPAERIGFAFEEDREKEKAGGPSSP